MSEVTVLLIVGAALAAGLIVNRWARPFAQSETEGIKLEALLGPIMSLTVLLLAFTIISVFESYGRAVDSASDEARTVDFLYELGGYSPQPVRDDLQSAVACYAAAVAGPEWDLMHEGRTAPEVSPWTTQIRAAIEELVASDTPTPVLSAVVTTDKERSEARSQRLTEVRPAMPGPLFGLLVGSTAVGMFALATFALASVARRTQVGVLVLLAILLALFVGLIRDLDRPYDGVVSVAPTDIERVSADLAEEWAEDHPSAELPCTHRGESRR